MPGVLGVGLDPVAGRPLQLRRRRYHAPDVVVGQKPGQPSTASGCGPSRALNISPVLASIPQATTDLACTSRPTLVRSRCTGTSRNCRHYRPGSPAPATHDNLRARSRPAGPGTSIPSNGQDYLG